MTDLLERFLALPNTLSASPILAIGLTLGAFFAGNWLFRRMGRPLWLPPVVSGVDNTFKLMLVSERAPLQHIINVY